MRAAGHLGRSPSTISRELANNRSADGPYGPSPQHAKPRPVGFGPNNPKSPVTRCWRS